MAGKSDFSYIEIIAQEKGYWIDNDGRLYYNNNICNNKPNNKGYKFFSVHVNRKVCKCGYHRLMAFQKFGKEIYKTGIVVRHLNGNPSDNSFNNIAIGTERDNYFDRPKEERDAHVAKLRIGNKGGGNGVVIPENIKSQIREDHKNGLGYKKLRKKYGHSLSGLVYICKNKNRVNNSSTQIQVRRDAHEVP